MQFIISSDDSSGPGDVKNWLEFNRLPFGFCQLWDEQDCIYQLPNNIENSILVCSVKLLQNLAAVPAFYHQRMTALEEFCSQGNRLWIVGDESALSLMSPSMATFIKNLDTTVSRFAITIFLDAEPTDGCYLRKLRHIQLKILPCNFFYAAFPRCQAPTTDKLAASYNFLLTMIRKRNRPHRDVLWKELCLRPSLKDRGLTSVRSENVKYANNWLGRTSHQHNWQDGHVSMDLYLDCWIEIVPETCYRDLYFFTEKTEKPIITRTPFLIVSAAGYLEWLRQQGFQTFHSLIDEGYDRHHRIEDRVHHMLNVLEHIVANGAEAFYRASGHILDHNFSRLCEIAGSKWYDFDETMWTALEESRA